MNTPKIYLVLICCLITNCLCIAQDTIIPLWEGPIPNQIASDEQEIQTEGDIFWIRKVQKPTLEVYLPTKKNNSGQAVVICPGGGYSGLAYDWEGRDIAKWFNTKGITAFVLKYRLPDSKSLKNAHEVPLMDAKRALRTVRHLAGNWDISTDKIGVMGFSAGGHLASSLATHYDSEDAFNDSIDAISARPDFVILIYPVITMNTQYTHMGSRKKLLGENPSEELVAYYSNELHVNQQTPPTFLIHSSDDEAVPVMNSIQFYLALQREKIYSEMHIYPTGGHGYSLAIGNDHLEVWPEHLSAWLKKINP